jgi:hypothetical protein
MNAIAESVEAFPTRQAGQLDVAPAEHRWLVDALWAEQGVGVLGGAPKACKSWLALEIATAVAAGVPCLGRFAVRAPGPTLVYLAEDGLPAVRDRIASLCDARGLDLDTLALHVITAPRLRLDSELDFRRLVATVEAIGPRLLVLDPFVRLHAADENRAGEIAAILVVHHARKVTAGMTPGQALRGSTDFYAWVDCLLYLARDRRGLRLAVEHRAAPAVEPFYVALDERVPHLRLVEPEDDDAGPSLDERVLAEIDRASAPLRRHALRARLAVNNQRLGDALARLEQQGQLRRTSDGWLR